MQAWKREEKEGSATCQEAGRFPSVPPPQSQSGKWGSTPQQPRAEGEPSRPSTFSGVVYNGQRPGGAAEREGCMGRHTGTHLATAASYTVHAGDLPGQRTWHSAEGVSSQWRCIGANDGCPHP